MNTANNYRAVKRLLFVSVAFACSANATQQYPLFSSNKQKPEIESPLVREPVSAVKPRREVTFQYNGFITLNNSRQFYINARPLSQYADLKLVSVADAGRTVVLEHKKHGRISLHLGQAAGRR